MVIRMLFWKVEMNPLWQQQKLRDFCASKGIHVTAYSPLGAKGTMWGGSHVMECEALKQIAEARGKTVAQVRVYFAFDLEIFYRHLIGNKPSSCLEIK